MKTYFYYHSVLVSYNINTYIVYFSHVFLFIYSFFQIYKNLILFYLLMFVVAFHSYTYIRVKELLLQKIELLYLKMVVNVKCIKCDMSLVSHNLLNCTYKVHICYHRIEIMDTFNYFDTFKYFLFFLNVMLDQIIFIVQSFLKDLLKSFNQKG